MAKAVKSKSKLRVAAQSRNAATTKTRAGATKVIGTKKRASTRLSRRPPIDPVPDPTLTRASISLHTNDDDKNDESRVDVRLLVEEGRTLVAKLSGFFGQVDDHSDIGPFTLVMFEPVGRNKLKNGHVEILLSHPHPQSGPVIPSDDIWRFSFFLDLFFADGGHLFAKANDVALSIYSPNSRTFGIE
jgi:hypothetical protein